jgi:hypothetical protein
MTEAAERLVEKVFPEGIAVRQYVLSMPWKIRYALARDAGLKRKALNIFLEEVFRELRERSRAGPRGKGGAVTGVQRFGGTLNLNVHFHSLVLDGVYVGDRFFRSSKPSPEDLQRIVDRVRDRILGLLRRHGLQVEPETGEEVPGETDVFDAIEAASIQGFIALSPPNDLRRVRLVGKEEGKAKPVKPGCAQAGGFSLHANVRIGGRNREGLKRLCRYVMRPPFSTERLSQSEAGEIVYRLKKPRGDGVTHMVLSPVEFLEKIAGLVPPPKAHLVHYHGVLGPSSKWRKRQSERIGRVRGRPSARSEGEEKECPSRWADLLKRTFGVDVLHCPQCGSGRMRIVAVLRRGELIRKFLGSLGMDVEEIESASRPMPARGLDPPDTLDAA